MTSARWQLTLSVSYAGITQVRFNGRQRKMAAISARLSPSSRGISASDGGTYLLTIAGGRLGVKASCANMRVATIPSRFASCGM